MLLLRCYIALHIGSSNYPLFELNYKALKMCLITTHYQRVEIVEMQPLAVRRRLRVKPAMTG